MKLNGLFKLAASALSILALLLLTPLASAQDASTGSIQGSVIENIENVHGIDVALVDADGVAVDLTDSDGTTWSTVTQNGTYAFFGLAPGDYDLTVHARDRRSAVASVPVAAGLTTTANAVLISRKDAGVFIYSEAMGIDHGVSENPDVNLDGKVDNADLGAVRDSVGEELDGSPLDINRDGVIDDQDVAAVEAAFGKVTIMVDTKYQAQVTSGGSIAVIGDGVASVQSESGSTTGWVRWAPVASPQPIDPVGTAASLKADRERGVPVQRPSTKNQAALKAKSVETSRLRFTVTEDQGVASSPEIGLFNFSENPDDLTWIDVDLTTGRVLDGRIGLTLSGGAFEQPVDIAGDVPDGIIAFIADGFALYHVVNVQGTLPSDFPVFAGMAFTMGKCDPPKADIDCDTQNAKPTDTCKWAIGGTGTCTGVGSICATESAACASGGSCKKCQTQCTRTLGGVLCDCWCLP